MDASSRRQLRDTLRALLTPVVERCGCDLVCLEISGSGVHPTLRMYIDRPGGVSIEHCSMVSHAVSPLLDVADPLPDSYELEVSSPGIERPVERREDFLRFQGFRAKVRLVPGAPNRNLSGVLRGLDGDDVLLESQGEQRRLPMASLEKVRLDLSLEEFEKLGAHS